MFEFIKRIFKIKNAEASPAAAHAHKWDLQYRTGNADDGKSDVCKCKCGQWAVRHYGKAEYTLLN